MQIIIRLKQITKTYVYKKYRTYICFCFFAHMFYRRHFQATELFILVFLSLFCIYLCIYLPDRSIGPTWATVVLGWPKIKVLKTVEDWKQLQMFFSGLKGEAADWIETKQLQWCHPSIQWQRWKSADIWHFGLNDIEPGCHCFLSFQSCHLPDAW